MVTAVKKANRRPGCIKKEIGNGIKGGSTHRDGVCPAAVALGWVWGQGACPWGRGKERSITLALQRGRGIGNMRHVMDSYGPRSQGWMVMAGEANTSTAPLGIATTGAAGSGCCAWVFKRGWIIFTTTNDPICA